MRIHRSTLKYLTDLKNHNERPWFEAHKESYLTAQTNMVMFAEALLEVMRTRDKLSTPSGKASLMRIHTDQRFHKDRSPYASPFRRSFRTCETGTARRLFLPHPTRWPFTCYVRLHGTGTR